MDQPQPTAARTDGVVRSDWTPRRCFAILDETVAAIAGSLATYAAGGGLRERGERAGQYRLDMFADDAALEVLDAAGVGVLSEESGRHRPEHPLCVVVDPVDGSTNASRRIPWYAASLCAIDGDGPLAAQVTNLATGTTWRAARGQGATRDGEAIRVSGAERLDESVLVVNGYPPAHLGWRQYRSLGATALDLCLVADGGVDGYADFGGGALGPWDYLAGMLIVEESGGVVRARSGGLVTLEHSARRSVVAAGSHALLDVVAAAGRPT